MSKKEEKSPVETKEVQQPASQIVVKRAPKPKLEPKFFGELKLVFTPRAFSKVMHWRHNSKGWEISGQGISYSANRLYIDDFELVKQASSSGATEFDDQGWLDFMNKMRVERKLQPFQYLSVLVHTHPGFATTPSGTDEKNWKDRIEKDERSFYVMCIVSNGTKDAHVRLFMREPVSLITKIPIQIDWSGPKMTETPEQLDAIFNELVSSSVTPFTYGGYNPTLHSWQRGAQGWQNSTQKKPLKGQTPTGVHGSPNASQNFWLEQEKARQKAIMQQAEGGSGVEEVDEIDIEIGIEEEIAKELAIIEKKEKEFKKRIRNRTVPARVETKVIWKPCKDCKVVLKERLLVHGVCQKCRQKKEEKAEKETFKPGNVVELLTWEKAVSGNNIYIPDTRDKKLFGQHVTINSDFAVINGNRWFSFLLNKKPVEWPKYATKLVKKA